MNSKETPPCGVATTGGDKAVDSANYSPSFDESRAPQSRRDPSALPMCEAEPESVRSHSVSRFPNRVQRSTTIRLDFVPWSEMRDLPDEQTPYVVDRLLPSAGSSMLVGEPKAGKSTIARALIADVLTGREFVGRTCKPGSVLYLCLEDKPDEVKQHFRALIDHSQLEHALFVHTGPAPLDLVQGLKQLEAAIWERSPALVVIDVLHRFARIDDLNDYAKVSSAMEGLTDLARRTGCHVLALHHAGKGHGSSGIARVLGSTALAGAVDTVMFYCRRAHGRTLEATHLRYGDELPETVMELDSITRRVRIGCAYANRNDDEIKAKIRDAVSRGVDTEDNIREAVGGDTGKTGHVLRDMVKAGELHRTEKASRGNPYKYSLPVESIKENVKEASERPCAGRAAIQD